jgi:hypothetical protein
VIEGPVDGGTALVSIPCPNRDLLLDILQRGKAQCCRRAIHHAIHRFVEISRPKRYGGDERNLCGGKIFSARVCVASLSGLTRFI